VIAAGKGEMLWLARERATATQQKSSNAELIICCSGRGGNKCNKLLIAMAA
jgi:hypothetical protein